LLLTITYYYQRKHPKYKLLPNFKPSCNTDVSKVLDIICSEEGAKIYVPIEASSIKGNTIFTATHRNKKTKLYWHLDDAYVGTTQQFHQLAVNLMPGKHVLTIIDEQGNSVSRNFEVLRKEKH
jgi:penicillin-binding protein 1C